MPLHNLTPRNGRDWGSPNLDALGCIYISATILHTALVIFLTAVLWHYKTTNSIRLRCFGSIVLTISFLQIFSIFVLLAYPLNGLYKCGVEFWVMSTMLPLSMALFQGECIPVYLRRYSARASFFLRFPCGLRTWLIREIPG
jgi:hypothetical protein